MSLLTAPVKDVAHLMVIRTKSDLDRMIAWARELSLLVEGGEDEPRDLLEVVSDRIEKYEDEHYRFSDYISPEEVMLYLMEKHGDSQSDMTDIAARPTINAILNGKRRLTRDMIERLMKKYGVSGDFFYS
jgi:antitoxin component HigA of HigAB toxin-antitoxin module